MTATELVGPRRRSNHPARSDVRELPPHGRGRRLRGPASEVRPLRWPAERGRGRRHHRRRSVPRRLHAPAHHRRDHPCVASTEPTVAGVDRAVATTAAEPGVRRDDVTDYDNRTEWRAECPTDSRGPRLRSRPSLCPEQAALASASPRPRRWHAPCLLTMRRWGDQLALEATDNACRVRVLAASRDR